MNRHQLNRSVTYHGNTLVDHLVYERQNFERSLICSPDRDQVRNRGEIRDREFTNSIQRFIAKKADLLFSNDEENPSKALHMHQTYDPGDDYYSILPPLETFMGIPPDDCKNHFYDSLEKKDVVIAAVTSILDGGLIVTLLSLDNSKARDIDHLKITTFCPCKELPRHYNYANPIEAFQVNDKIRGIVLNVNRENKKILISMLDKHMEGENPPKLGLITDEDVPVHYRRKVYYRGLTYEELLHTVIGFNNSGSIPYLLQLLNHPHDTGSITRSLHKFSVPETEYAEALRLAQSRKIANKNVAEGISLFKNNQGIEAMQMFNKALQIDSGNVEALVARGALYANNESYKRAIEDFEEAFAANPRHQNACKYLCQTLVAQGKILEEQRLLSEAEGYYKRALHIDPHYEEAGRYLHYISKSNPGNKSGSSAGLECTTNIENSPHSSLEGVDRSSSQKKKKGHKTTPSFKRIVASERIPQFRKDVKCQDGSVSDASSSASSRPQKSWSRSSVDRDSNVSQQSYSKIKQPRYSETCDSTQPDTHALVLGRNTNHHHSPRDYKSESTPDKRCSKPTVGSSCWNTTNEMKSTGSKSPEGVSWKRRSPYPESLPSMNPYDHASSAYKMKGQTIADRNRAKGKSQSREFKEIYINKERSKRPVPFEGVADLKSKRMEATDLNKCQTAHDTASSTHSQQLPAAYKYSEIQSDSSHEKRPEVGYQISKMLSPNYDNTAKLKKPLPPELNHKERKEKHTKDFHSKKNSQQMISENDAFSKNSNYQSDFKSQSHRKLDRKRSSRQDARDECEPSRKRSRKHSPSITSASELSDNPKYQKCKLPDIIESTRNVIENESQMRVETSRKHSGSKPSSGSSSKMNPNGKGSKSIDKDPTRRSGSKGKHRKRRSRSTDSSSSSSSSSSTSSSSSSSSSTSSSSTSYSGLRYHCSKRDTDPDSKARRRERPSCYSESGESRTKKDGDRLKDESSLGKESNTHVYNHQQDSKSKSEKSKSNCSPRPMQSDKTCDLYEASREEEQDVMDKSLSKEISSEKYQSLKEQNCSSSKDNQNLVKRGKSDEPLSKLGGIENDRETNLVSAGAEEKSANSGVSKFSINESDQTRAFADELQKSTKNLSPSRLTETEAKIDDSEKKLPESKRTDIFRANLPEESFSKQSPESGPSSSCANYNLEVKNVCVGSDVNSNHKLEPSPPPPPLPNLNPPPLPPLPPLSPPSLEGNPANNGNCGDNTGQVVNDDRKNVVEFCEKDISKDGKKEKLQESGLVNSSEKKNKNIDSTLPLVSCKNKEEICLQSTETLDELESFLSQLKEKKKQQMLAEGKNQKWKKL